MTPGYLVLEDGTVFRGRSVGAAGTAFGEAVFTTAMTGYQETVTDPSYAEQLVCFTAPMVGNYGVAAGRSESTATHAKAVLMREARGPEWTAWLEEQGVVALTGIDTRSLVLRLREGGAMRAVAAAGALDEREALDAVRSRRSMQGAALVARVSSTSGSGSPGPFESRTASCSSSDSASTLCGKTVTWAPAPARRRRIERLQP